MSAAAHETNTVRSYQADPLPVLSLLFLICHHIWQVLSADDRHSQPHEPRAQVDVPIDTVGRAVPGVEVRVVSLEDGKPVGPGEVGEIQARSDSVMAGYLPDEATAQAFSDGWYRTGDVGYLDVDGWLRITDRAKEMIKVRGFQVAPAEIEAVLHGHPGVDDCAVFGVDDEANGEAVVAAVATHGSVDPDELVALVSERLASYKQLSRVVVVPEIPRLPSGKVLRRVLKERRDFSDGLSHQLLLRRTGV